MESTSNHSASSRHSRIATLSAKISSNTECVDAYHHKNGLPDFSFDEAPIQGVTYPPDVERARRTAIECSQELSELLQGPRQWVTNQQHHFEFVFHRIIYELDIARKVPLDGSISYEELSQQTGWPASVLKRILRYAIVNRIFREPEDGQIAHSAGSRILAEDPTMTDMAKLIINCLESGTRLYDAMVKWPDHDGLDHTAYCLAHPDNAGSLWADLAADPENAKSFSRAMSAFGEGAELSLTHVASGYDWAGVGEAKVVDLGGSVGDVAFMLAERFPKLDIVCQDTAATLSGAQEREGAKVRFMVHDFFNVQPVKDADIYFFRWIFHDWSDKACRQMLEALIPALKPGAKVLIMDLIMPPPGLMPTNAERIARIYDIGMQSFFNAGERDLTEWETLFRETDSRLKLERVYQPEGSRLSIMELQYIA